MDISSKLGIPADLLPSSVKRLFRAPHKRPGHAPGTLVYTGPERSEPVSVHLLEYDQDRL